MILEILNPPPRQPRPRRPVNTPTVEYVRRLRDTGLSLREIAHKLNAAGYTTLRGRPFLPFSVSAYLGRDK
jgi:hypothetical protein